MKFQRSLAGLLLVLQDKVSMILGMHIEPTNGAILETINTGNHNSITPSHTPSDGIVWPQSYMKMQARQDIHQNPYPSRQPTLQGVKGISGSKEMKKKHVRAFKNNHNQMAKKTILSAESQVLPDSNPKEISLVSQDYPKTSHHPKVQSLEKIDTSNDMSGLAPASAPELVPKNPSTHLKLTPFYMFMFAIMAPKFVAVAREFGKIVMPTFYEFHEWLMALTNFVRTTCFTCISNCWGRLSDGIRSLKNRVHSVSQRSIQTAQVDTEILHEI